MFVQLDALRPDDSPSPNREVSPTSAEPAGNEPSADPPGFLPGSAAMSGGHGMGMCWAGDIAMEEILAAAERLRRTRAGYDVPAWGEPERPAKGEPARLAGSPSGPDPLAQNPPGETRRLETAWPGSRWPGTNSLGSQ